MPMPYPAERGDDVMFVERTYEPSVTIKQTAGVIGVHPMTVQKPPQKPAVVDSAKPRVRRSSKPNSESITSGNGASRR